MTDLSQSIRDYAEFLDEIAIRHARPMVDPAENSDHTADLIVLDPLGAGSPVPSLQRGRVVAMALVAAALLLIVGIVGLVRLNDAPRPDVQADDGDVVVVDEPAESAARAEVMTRLIAWMNADLGDDELSALLGQDSNIPESFFANLRPELDAPFDVRGVVFTADRSERVLAAAGGGLASLVAYFDGDTPARVEIGPAVVPDTSDAARVMELFDEQVQWLNGAAFTERDFVQSFSAVQADSFQVYTDLVEDAAGQRPFEVVLRASNAAGASALLRGGDGELHVLSFSIVNGRIDLYSFGTDGG